MRLAQKDARGGGLGTSPYERELFREQLGPLVKHAIDDLRCALNCADSVVALTGAGISAESGVPTFRGPNGLWRNYRPEELATPAAIARSPRLVWEWYDWRRGIVQRAQPNPGHLALAALERRSPGGFTLITQNVDGLHDRAGSKNLIKLHGDLWLVECTGCGAVERNDEVPFCHLPPQCGRCRRSLRPAVVWFGEPLPAQAWESAVQASGRARVFLVIGTSAVVYPAAGLAEMARQAGARLAVVNPEPTPLDPSAEWVVRGASGEILPRLL